MSLKVCYVLGRFPVPTEYPVLREIAAIADLGAEVAIAAVRPVRERLPAELKGLSACVSYLDRGRIAGRAPAAVLGLLAVLASRLKGGGRTGADTALPRVASHPLAARWRVARLARIVRNLRPDVLHAQFGHLGFLALPAARFLGVPLVLSFRGQDVALVRGVPEERRAELFGRAAAVLARSDEMRRDLLALGVPEGKLRVLPTGIDVRAIPFRERFAPGTGEPVCVLTVARPAAKKGIEDARAAVELCRRRYRIEWRWVRGVSHDEVLREMDRAHIFLLPCRTGPDGEKEGIPNALKEAMAAGLPVVSTRHAGIPECVAEGESGLLAAERDVRGIADRLGWLLDHPEAWAAMGRRGRAIIEERYDLRDVALRLSAHYDELARKDRSEH